MKTNEDGYNPPVERSMSIEEALNMLDIQTPGLIKNLNVKTRTLSTEETTLESRLSRSIGKNSAEENNPPRSGEQPLK